MAKAEAQLQEEIAHITRELERAISDSQLLLQEAFLIYEKGLFAAQIRYQERIEAAGPVAWEQDSQRASPSRS